MKTSLWRFWSEPTTFAKCPSNGFQMWILVCVKGICTPQRTVCDWFVLNRTPNSLAGTSYADSKMMLRTRNKTALLYTTLPWLPPEFQSILSVFGDQNFSSKRSKKHRPETHRNRDVRKQVDRRAIWVIII